MALIRSTFVSITPVEPVDFVCRPDAPYGETTFLTIRISVRSNTPPVVPVASKVRLFVFPDDAARFHFVNDAPFDETQFVFSTNNQELDLRQFRLKAMAANSCDIPTLRMRVCAFEDQAGRPNEQDIVVSKLYEIEKTPLPPEPGGHSA